MEQFPFVGGGAENNDWKKIFVRRSRLKKGWEGGKSGDFSVTSMRGHDGYINSIDILKNQAITGGSTGQIKVWRTNTSKLSYECSGHTGLVTGVKFNDIYILSGSTDRTVKLWDTQTGTMLRSMDCDNSVSSISFNADTAISCVGTYLDIHDIRSAQRTVHQFGSNATVKSFFLENGNFAVARTNGVSIYHPANPNVAIHNYNQAVTHMEFGGSDMLALASGQDVVLWNYVTGQPVWTCRLPTASAITVFKADSSRILIGTQDGNLMVMRHRNPAIKSIVAHQGGVNDLQFDAQRVVTAGADNSIKVWDIQSGNMLYTLLGGSLQIRGTAKPHPSRGGCSALVYDENRIVGSFANVLKSFNFTND
jgi:WD40 repeat protein